MPFMDRVIRCRYSNVNYCNPDTNKRLALIFKFNKPLNPSEYKKKLELF